MSEPDGRQPGVARAPMRVSENGASVGALLTRMRSSAFQGRKLGEAFEAWKQMIDGSALICLGLAGSLSSAMMRSGRCTRTSRRPASAHRLAPAAPRCKPIPAPQWWWRGDKQAAGLIRGDEAAQSYLMISRQTGRFIVVIDSLQPNLQPN